MQCVAFTFLYIHTDDLPVRFRLVLEVVHVTARFRILSILVLSYFSLGQVQQVTMVLNNKISLFESFESKHSSSFSFNVFDLLTFNKCYVLTDLLKMLVTQLPYKYQICHKQMASLSHRPTLQYVADSKWHITNNAWYLHSFFTVILYQIINVSVFFTLIKIG